VIVIPAIDLMEGHAVRLAEGDRDRVTRYSADPVELIARFARAGAPWIHIVDLDGAFSGSPVQLPLVRDMVVRAHELGSRVQVGGGMRSREAVEQVLGVGADRVVVGTLAVRAPADVAALCREHPDRIVVAIDARDGVVAVDGWREAASLTAHELAVTAQGWGAAAVLHTDVARDGLQVGPAVHATADIQKDVTIPVIASGGVGALADLDALQSAGIEGVVLGRALYEGSFSVEEALARC
jgi:phosphoribosylformimino-5-aminoimidazole carboxamide ribotide isomerase